MVFTVKCDECGKLAEYGNEKKYLDNKVQHLEDYIEFDDRILCKECVTELVEFGVGDLQSKIENIENVIDELGREAGIDVESIKQAHMDQE